MKRLFTGPVGVWDLDQPPPARQGYGNVKALRESAKL